MLWKQKWLGGIPRKRKRHQEKDYTLLLKLIVCTSLFFCTSHFPEKLALDTLQYCIFNEVCAIFYFVIQCFFVRWCHFTWINFFKKNLRVVFCHYMAHNYFIVMCSPITMFLGVYFTNWAIRKCWKPLHNSYGNLSDTNAK